MISVARLNLVGDDQELEKIAEVLEHYKIVFKRHKDLDEACEQQEIESSDIFILGPSLFFQVHLNQIQKCNPSPGVVLACGEKLPNLAKILVPTIIFANRTREEIYWAVQQLTDSHRRKKRLDALRDHHKRSVNVDANPAIQLVTNLMRKCTVAEEYPDLLSAILTLRNVIDFQDCSLVTFDSNEKPINAWHSSMETKDRVSAINISEMDALATLIEEGKVTALSSNENSEFSCLTLNPWSSCLAIRFSSTQAPRKKGVAKSAILLIFRRQLFPFLERDHWLLELTYGPLSLALEKVAMLKAIGQASKEWRATFDGISEALTVIDSNYQVVKANKAFAKLVDTDIKKIKGKRCFNLLANRRSPCVGCPVNFEQQPNNGTRLQLAGKEKKDLLVWSYGIRTGLDTYFFQFYRNVSKETSLTATLIQSEKMAALGRLVGAVAHEINNPLAGILATSQILLQEKDIKSDLRDDLEEIRSAAWRSKKIIDDLLGFTSSEEKVFENFPPLEIVKSALTFSKAALKDIKVETNNEAGEAQVYVSVSALQQILFNLITNAAHAMNGKGNLKISTSLSESEICFSVKDSGPGISSERISRIFDPFYTSKQEGFGTGLGLSIVKNLATKIKSRIEVSSKLGEGTEFRVYVPKVGERNA